MSKKRNVQMI